MTAPRRLVQDDDTLAANATHVVVFGGGRTGMALAESLADTIDSVTLVGRDADPDTAVGTVTVLQRSIGDAAEVRALGAAVGPVDVVIATGSDSEALLAGHLARRELDPEVVIATVTDPTRSEAFENTGIDRIDVPDVLAEHIRARLEDALV